MPTQTFTFPTTGISTPPFTLNGQPFSNRPESVKGVSEKRRKESASKNPDYNKYLDPENYYIVDLDTRNIIGSILSETTLRADGVTYNLQFIAIHRNIWYAERGQGGSIQNQPQISLFFMTANGDKMYHICIPINYTTDATDENLFLKFWLHQNPPASLPSGFTLNLILNFRKPFAQFVKLNYCLSYNQESAVSSYTLCLFNTPLNLNKTNLPSWLQNDLDFKKSAEVPKENEQKVYIRKSFDEILNLMLPGKFKFYSAPGKIDPFLISTNTIFSTQNRNNVIQPSYYSVATEDLTGKLLYQRFIQKKDGQRSLNNLKCYPIDIINQIDPKTGEILIDEETNKPIDPKIAVATSEENSLDVELKAKENQDWWIGTIVFLSALLILGLVIIVISLFVLKGKSSSVNEVVAAAMPGPATP